MQQTKTPALVAEHLTKRIGKRTIVSDVSFRVDEGEIFGFLGPNGAGKTTTIRMIVGLIRPTSGHVTICDHRVDREFEKAMRCLGCIVETPDLYRFLTGRENLEHFARMRGPVNPHEIEDLGDLVGLTGRLDDRVRTYSLGMRQRLGIAQALLGGPRLLILDEPANGLDPAGIHEIRELLRTLAKTRGIAVFISSHLLAEIELICDRVAIIHHGSILVTGAVEELVARQRATRIVASDNAGVIAIAQRRGFEASEREDGVDVSAGDEEVPPLVREIVESGIAVTRVQPVNATLEEAFLLATSDERRSA